MPQWPLRLTADAARVAESIGLVIIAVIIVVIPFARYGRAVHWSLR